MGGRRSREPSALHPPCSVARKVRHAEIAALAPHDRPGADVASGADHALKPFSRRSRLLQRRRQGGRSGYFIHRDWVRVLRRAGLRRIRFHDLRHTYASLLIAQGAHPKYIQTQLGHASRRRSTATGISCLMRMRRKRENSIAWCLARGGRAASMAPLTRCSGSKTVAETTKGSAAMTANPLSPAWLRGLDLNQRPLGYEGNSSHQPQHRPTTNPDRYALPRRLVLEPFGGCFRRVFGRGGDSTDDWHSNRRRRS